MTPKSRKVILYTLLTEYRDNLASLVGNYFDGATITRGVGLWQGTREDSARIEVIGDPEDWQAVSGLATAIRNVNEQSSVYVLETDVTLTEIIEHV